MTKAISNHGEQAQKTSCGSYLKKSTSDTTIFLMMYLNLFSTKPWQQNAQAIIIPVLIAKFPS